MPIAINRIATYIPNCDDFNAHLTSVNTDRVENALAEISLKGGYTRAMFEADRNALEAAISATEGFENALELATTTRRRRCPASRRRRSRASFLKLGQYRPLTVMDLGPIYTGKAGGTQWRPIST